ncbi:MAG TPA: NAD-dependent epimerase/dehydratase family protein [Ktedonobacterales bacterium]|nr:NAD-dependent epimerase/dehydratase family protein [Ktedonobacterales bacterium]
MDILITGGNGFLGHNLIQALQARGDRVRVLALPQENTDWLEARGVRVFRGDIRTVAVLTEPMRGVDGVFHLAAMLGAWRSMREYRDVNVTGTEHVCRAALAAGVKRLVHISSAMVYDMSVGRPVNEEDPLQPLDEPYCMSKAEGDVLVQRLIAWEHLPAVILRPGTLFGPGDRLNFGRIADRVKAGKMIVIGSGDNAVPFVYVDDMVNALLLAMDVERAVGQVYNIGNDHPLSQAELYNTIAREIGASPVRIHVPYNPLYAAAAVAERVANLTNNRILPPVTRHGVKLYGANNLLSIDKARRELGYAPTTPLREGVRITAEWYTRQQAQSPDHAIVTTQQAMPIR